MLRKACFGVPETPRPPEHPGRPLAGGLVIPKDLRDVVFVGNLLGGPMFDHGKEPTGEPLARPEIDDDRYRVLAEEIEAECQELLGVLS